MDPESAAHCFALRRARDDKEENDPGSRRFAARPG
jgi:hypothetical protein